MTVTDANLVLGRLNPQALLSVADAPSVAALEAAFEEQIGAPLGLNGRDAAAAVLRVANDLMAGALRLVSLERGHDPRDLALFAFGGAGPLHAVELAREIGVPTVLVPARPGLTNALGCVVADIRHEFVRTVNAPLASLETAALRDILEQQAEAGRALVAQEKVPVTQVREITAADMQFQGQTHLLRVDFDAATLEVASLQQAFEEAYLKRFHVELSEIRAVLVNLHTTVIGERPALDISRLMPAEDDRKATTRSAMFDGAWHDTPVLPRRAVPSDAALQGPAIIEQSDTTIVVPPGASARHDAVGNLLIHPAPPVEA